MKPQVYPVYAVAAGDLDPSRDRPVAVAGDTRAALRWLEGHAGTGLVKVELHTTVFCEFWAGHVPAVIARCNGLPEGSWGVRQEGPRRFLDVTGWFIAAAAA